tara:strand:+ start:402 stop:521 length:120 start_codon:yes stop_codon:yes gene_type:complete
METLEQMKERQRQQQQRRAVYKQQSKAIVSAYQRVRKSK